MNTKRKKCLNKTPGTKLHVGPSLLWNLELEILTAVIDDCENDDCEYDD